VVVELKNQCLRGEFKEVEEDSVIKIFLDEFAEVCHEIVFDLQENQKILKFFLLFHLNELSFASSVFDQSLEEPHQPIVKTTLEDDSCIDDKF
jgi:hypothetical protein